MYESIMDTKKVLLKLEKLEKQIIQLQQDWQHEVKRREETMLYMQKLQETLINNEEKRMQSHYQLYCPVGVVLIIILILSIP